MAGPVSLLLPRKSHSVASPTARPSLVTSLPPAPPPMSSACFPACAVFTYISSPHEETSSPRLGACVPGPWSTGQLTAGEVAEEARIPDEPLMASD